MSNNGGISSSRVPIPNSVRKTIQNIKEITNNHSEDDIYAMLKECSMDPNETTQRLLHLDTFHEVKSKRDKRKEMVKNRSGEEPRWKPGHQGRGMRGARGNSSSQYNAIDAGVGVRRNSYARNEKAVEDRKEKGFRKPPAEESASMSVNGQIKVPNGSVVGRPDTNSFQVGDAYHKDTFVAGTDSSTLRANAGAEHAPLPSDLVLVPLRESGSPVVGTIKREVMIQQEASGTVSCLPAVSKAEVLSNKHQSDTSDLDVSEVSLSKADMVASETANLEHSNDLRECTEAEECCVLNGAENPSSLRGLEEAAMKPEKLEFSQRQHVIIPNHIQVPDAVKNVLSFGSIDASFRARGKHVITESVKNLNPIGDSASEKAANKLPSGDNDAVTTTWPAQHTDYPECPSMSDKASVDNNVPSASNLKDSEPKADNFSALGPPFPIVATPSYSFGFMPPMLANTPMQPEGLESQAHASSSLSGSLPIVSTPSSTPPSTQSVAAGQNSIVSPQLIPYFRQPYPPNLIPYGHYFSPFYAPPTMHQYYGHAGFPAPVAGGNVFLPPPSSATAMKASPGHYKPGGDAGNQAPSGIPSGYVSQSSSEAGYCPNGEATPGNASTSEDLLPSSLKGSSMYPGQQSNGTGVWNPTAGRDASSFPLNSFLNHPLQGQHVISPHANHGTFAVYHALQPMGNPAPGLPLLQQSQPVVGPIDSVGPPPNAYQQPQRQPQSNWQS